MREVYFSLMLKSFIYELLRTDLLGRNAMTSLQSILKSRDMTVLTKV